MMFTESQHATMTFPAGAYQRMRDLADPYARERGESLRCSARVRLFCSALVALAIVAFPAHAAQRNGFDLAGALVPIEEILQGGPPRDGIPAIDNPKFVAAKDARFLTATTQVIGVARRGIAKAYPIPILNWHEIVNDVFADEHVAITFCPLCGTGMAFSSTVGERRLQFGVSGLLYNSDVLLYDRQTESLWSQIAAKAVAGPMKGRSLVALPVSHTTWDDWRRRHPGTLVLSPNTGHTRDYARDPYADYVKSSELFFPVRQSSAKFHPKERVLGVTIAGRSKAYPLTELARTDSPLDETLGGQRFRVEHDVVHGTARVLDAAGREIPSLIAFWFAWYAFHPSTAVYIASAPRAAAKK